MPERGIRLVHEGQSTFNKCFLHFNIKKKMQAKSYPRFASKCSILDTASLGRQFIAIILPTS